MLLYLLILSTTPFVSRGEKDYQIGSTYTFTSIWDEAGGGVITVNPIGDVLLDVDMDSPEQEWTLATNPHDSFFLEFKQAVVPFNQLSGWEDDPNNPGVFPRPLGLKKLNNGSLDMWNIRIRGRWCLQSRGLGVQLDYDDCEDYEWEDYPWQLWRLDKA